jgi:hypothetical protein
MRAAYDEEKAAISRLRSAAQLASAQGSVALLRRCEHDLAGHGLHRPGPPRPDMRHWVPSSAVPQNWTGG